MLYEVLAGAQRSIDLLLQEVGIAWRVHHPNIAAVCGVTLEIDDEKKTARIVMELLQGSMANVINESQRPRVQQLTLREKVDLARDSLCGLDHLHTLVSWLQVCVRSHCSSFLRKGRLTDCLADTHRN